MHKQLDRGADKFELYLARNIFKVPSSSSSAAAAEVGGCIGQAGRRTCVCVCVCVCVCRAGRGAVSPSVLSMQACVHVCVWTSGGVGLVCSAAAEAHAMCVAMAAVRVCMAGPDGK